MAVASALGGEHSPLVGLLRELCREVPGVRGAWLATVDGLPLAHSFIDADGEARVEPFTSAAAMVAATLGLGQRLAELAGDGRMQEATVRSTSGYVVLYAVGDLAVLTVLTHPGVNVARVHLTARDLLDELATVIAQEIS